MIRTFCDHCNTELHDRPYYRGYDHPRTHFPVKIAGLDMAVQVQWPQGIVLDICDDCFEGHVRATLEQVYKYLKTGYVYSTTSREWLKSEATIEVKNKGLNKS